MGKIDERKVIYIFTFGFTCESIMSRKFTVLKSEDVVLRLSWGHNVNLLEGVWISYINISMFKSNLFSFLSPCTLSCVCAESLSHVQFFVTPWTATCQASPSFTISWSLLKFMSTELVMLSNCLILLDSLIRLCQIKPWEFRVNSFLKLSEKSIHVCLF